MAIPETMRAVTARGAGGPEVLELGEHPVPEPTSGQLLVKVAAAGVNRPDCLQRAGSYPPPPGAGPILGLEVAGTVVGGGGARFKPGDAVCALVIAGGYAEYVAVDEGAALPLPPGLSLEEAAAVPETYFTVWSNVFDRGRLRAGEWFLVHGGTSGIGTTAIQLAKAFGAKVVATAGSAEKCAAMSALGADLAVNYREEDFVAACKRAAPEGIHLTLDMVGGDYVEKNWAVAASEGRIVQIATLNGPSHANFGLLMRKRLTHTGSTLRPREAAFKAAIARALEDQVWPLLASGRVRVVLDKAFPLAQAGEAHRRMEASAHVGKIILTP
jgi:NADPH2:quinone reductase